jgi:hypothetical protein
VDSKGNVFFESGGAIAYSVLRVDAVTGMLTTVAGNRTPGYSGDTGPATTAQLNGVTQVAMDEADNLYIADDNNDVVRKVLNGIITTVAGGGGVYHCTDCPATSASLGGIWGLSADSAGNLYILAATGVKKVSNGLITDLYDGFAPGSTGTSAVDSGGNVYIASLYTNQIFKLSGDTISVVAGGIRRAGASPPCLAGDNGPATSAQLAGPRGVAIDAQGNVYIAETGNQRIRKVSNGVITTVAGGGTPSSGLGDNGPATSAGLNYPFGVAVDSAGNIYIEDTLDKRIRKVSNGIITTIAGGGSIPVLAARSAGTFAATGSMSERRGGHRATLLGNGKVLVAGGFTSVLVPDSGGNYHQDLTAVSTAELYDPASGTFAPAGKLTSGLIFTTASLLADGRVVLFGTAHLNACDTTGAAELYDRSTGTFIPLGNLYSITCPRAAVLLNTGKVLIIGPDSSESPFFATKYAAELYDPLTGAFTLTGAPTEEHSTAVPVLIPSGKVLIGDLCNFELYDPASGIFSALPKTWGCPVHDTLGVIGATLLADGKVLLLGIENKSTVLDPSTGTASSIGGIADSNQHATLLPDQTVLISGGERCLLDDPLCFNYAVADADIFDPGTQTFGFGASMTTPREAHQSTLLPDGRVLITGGFWDTDEKYLSSAEIYTPPVLSPAPKLFSISGDGKGQGAMWHADKGKAASSDSPATAGDALFTTGLTEGGAIPPRVAVGGQFAEILYFGDVPGYPGVGQMNFRVPRGATPGVLVPVQLMYLDRPSNAATIALQ